MGSSYTAFEGFTRLARGSSADVALAAKAAREARPEAAILIFDDATGRAEDFDLRGDPAHIAARLDAQNAVPPSRTRAASDAPRGRGRPKLGVVSREVTLLPRHWDWLAGQPGGASAALRRLVDEARKSRAAEDAARRAREAAYAFMFGIGGDLPEFEEASRALFAGDRDGLAARMAEWPGDVRTHVLELFDGGTR